MLVALALAAVLGCCGKCGGDVPTCTATSVSELPDGEVDAAVDVWLDYTGLWVGPTLTLGVGSPYEAEWLAWDDGAPGLGGPGCPALTAPVDVELGGGRRAPGWRTPVLSYGTFPPTAS